MRIAADKGVLTALTVANLACCPLYLAAWFFAAAGSAAAVPGDPHATWQPLFLDALLLLAGACLLLPVLAWVLAGRRPRAALVAMIAPIAPIVGGFALAHAASALTHLTMR